MNKNSISPYIFFVFFSSILLIHCSGVRAPNEDYRNLGFDRNADLSDLDDQELDEVITDKELSLADKFSNIIKNIDKCKPSTPGVPQTTLDLGFIILNREKYNKLQNLRLCFRERLEKATESLCTAKQTIQAEQKKCRNYDFRCARLDTSVQRLEQLQRRYRIELRDSARSLSGCSDKDRILFSDECRAWEGIIQNEAQIACDYENRSSSQSRRY